MARKKTKKSRVKARSRNKVSAGKKARKKESVRKTKRKKKPIVERGISAEALTYETRGLGANSAGQAGDTQGLPKTLVGDSESVEGLLEEGQTFEAEILEGVESAPEADKSEVKTRQMPADDVPEEYLEKD